MERRRQNRIETSIEVDICHLHGECVGRIRDLGSRSLFIEIDNQNYPATGTIIHLNFRIWTGQHQLSRQASGEVARWDETGVAVLFAEQDIVARAVIEEILFYLRTSPGSHNLLPKPDAA